MIFYKNGEKQLVVVDDFIPCVSDGSKPCFSENHGNELWVILLEKAWAKLQGSYEATNGGHAHLALHDLTGAPSFDLEIDEEGLFE